MSEILLNKQLLFKFSAIGFALHCTTAFTYRIDNKIKYNNIDIINTLKNNDSIYISTNETNININKLVETLESNNIKINFYLLKEPNVSNNLIELLLPVSINIFCQNNIYNSPKVHIMPIGIRDCDSVVPSHKGFNHKYLLDEGIKSIDKTILCILCFSYTHKERNRCYTILKDKSYIVNLNDNTYEKQPSIHCGKVPVWINYEFVHKSWYALCPRGYGEDTHRFYESIYLDTIPIVKRSNTAFDKLYEVFPCLVVDDWIEVTEEFLINNKELYIQKIKDFKYRYPNIFTDINSIHELLLST
jgi:hypothetical protein